MAIANPLMSPEYVSGIKCVVFDCDGVLIDSYQANMVYYGTVKEKLGLPPMTDDEKYYVHSRTHDEALKHISGDQFEEALEIGRGVDSSSLMHYLVRSEGVREFLSWLRDAGFDLAVCTSRGDSMDLILQAKDLEGFFHPVVTSTKVVKPKPHPEGLNKIMRTYGVQQHEVAFIGDSSVDMKAAEAAGVRFWAYKDATLDAEVHIESFWDIKAVMQRCYKGESVTY